LSDKSRRFYLGIDLGTTNCSIAWGNVRANNSFRPRLVDMQLMMVDGSWETRQLLPSFIYFPRDRQEPEVGYKAKQMLKTQPSRVIRSIKTQMGTSLRKKIDGIEYTPDVISSFILKRLMFAIKKTFHRLINDVVVTVPGSFDSEMRSATLEAARLAGIKVKNKDGSDRNILLDEPRACLYDFVNRQKSGEIPDHIIDFSDEKIILVYDLGGGTLDVSLHKVNFNRPDVPIVNIEDIAISRFTDIGGDNFDEKLTEILFEKYLEDNNLNLKDFSDLEIELAKTTLFYYVEDFKCRITNDILMREEMSEEYEPEDVKGTIMAGYLLGQIPLSTELSLQEYEESMSEFLAWDIKYPTDSRINESIGEKNLISPIIDVLQKAHNKLGVVIRPDLILLSGGMTKLPMVQRRLEEFFNMEPQIIPDPDKAVSRGAAIYHYYLHQGYKPTTIIAESIYMEARDAKTKMKKLKEIVPAGVTLPCKFEFNFKTRGEKTLIGIPFYRTDKSHLLTIRNFILSKSYPEGSNVQAQVKVNTSKVLEFKAWLKDHPSEKISVSIDITGGIKKDKAKIEEKDAIDEEEKRKQIEEERQKLKEKTVGSREIHYKELVEFFKPISTTGKPNFTSFQEKDIIGAKNIEHVIRNLIKIQKQKGIHPKIREKIILLLGDLVSDSRIQLNYPKSIEQIEHNMIRYVNMIENLPNPNPREINTCVRYAIETIGKTKTIDLQRKVIDSLISWVNEPIFRKIRNAILISMGKMPPDSEIVEFLVNFLSKPQEKSTLISSLWALGKQGSRDLTNPIFIDYLGEVQDRILEIMDNSNDFETVQYIAYSLLELGKVNQYHPEICFSQEIRKEIIYKMENKLGALEAPFKKRFNHLDKKLKDWGRFLTTKRWLNLSIQTLKGLEVANEEMELLIEFRKR